MQSVPVVDLAASLYNSRKLGEQLGKAFQDVGFAVLVNHGISQSLLERVYSSAQLLFAYSDEKLIKYRRQEVGQQVGFVPLIGADKALTAKVRDHKRMYHVRRPHPATEPLNVWPEEVPSFRPVAVELFQELDWLSDHLLRGLDYYLGFAIGSVLPKMVHGGNTLMRFIHYPALTGQEPEDAERTADHTDINLITLLVAATGAGLEIQTQDHQWIPVNEEPGSIVVNVGDMLQLFSKWACRSTPHRVINRSEERFSIPFFVHPRADVVLTSENNYTAGEYLAKRLKQIGY